jgi:hypothetical protein
VNTVPKDQAIEALIDEIIVDAHNVDEQMMGFLQVFLDEVPLPAAAAVLGVAVEVMGFDSEGTNDGGS